MLTFEYAVLNNDIAGLQRGDSGSWVVNPDAGMVYGQVVATMGDSVFMLPMNTLIDEIERQRESAGIQVTASLPSPSILLTDLAQYHRDVLDDAETADKYEQAAFRARQLDGAEGIHPSVRPMPVTDWPLRAPGLAVSQSREFGLGFNLFPGMHGRDETKENSPPTPTRSAVWPKEDFSRISKSSARYSGDLLAQYTHMEFSKRAEFYDSLPANDQMRIDAYLRRLTQIRGAMASGKHSSVLKNLLSSVKTWRDTIETRNVPAWGRRHHGKSLGPEHSEGSLHQGPASPQLLEYDPLMDINVSKTTYLGSDDWTTSDVVDVKREAMPLKDILEDPARWLQWPMSPYHEARVTHIHIPATNIEVRTVSMQTWLTIPPRDILN